MSYGLFPGVVVSAVLLAGPSLSQTTASTTQLTMEQAAPIADFGASIIHPDSDFQTMAALMPLSERGGPAVSTGGGSDLMGLDHVVTALVRGEVTALTTEYTQALALAEQGVVRVIGVTSPEAFPLAEGSVSLHGQGIEMDFGSWTGFFAPPDMSDAENQGVEVRADHETFTDHLEEQHDLFRTILEAVDDG